MKKYFKVIFLFFFTLSSTSVCHPYEGGRGPQELAKCPVSKYTQKNISFKIILFYWSFHTLYLTWPVFHLQLVIEIIAILLYYVATNLLLLFWFVMVRIKIYTWEIPLIKKWIIEILVYLIYITSLIVKSESIKPAYKKFVV